MRARKPAPCPGKRIRGGERHVGLGRKTKKWGRAPGRRLGTCGSARCASARAAIVAQPIGDGPEGQAESLRWKRAP